MKYFEFNKKEDKNNDTTNPLVLSEIPHFNHQSLCLLRSVAFAATVFNMTGKFHILPINNKKELGGKLW